MRRVLADLAETWHGGAAGAKEDAIEIRLEESDLQRIDQAERYAAAADRLVSAIDEAMARR